MEGGAVTAKSESTTPHFPRGPRELVASAQEIRAASCLTGLQSPCRLHVHTFPPDKGAGPEPG